MSTIYDFPAMNWASFSSIPNGTRVVNYGYDQCVAVANLFHVSVLGQPLPSGLGAAYQWWTTYDSQPNTYNNYYKSSDPVAGAVVVWNTSWGGGYGHIGVVLSVNSDGTFNTLEQNAGYNEQRYVYRYRRGYSAVYGFLIPRNNPAASLEPHQRMADAQVRRRTGPGTNYEVKEPSLEIGDVGNFDGWIHGESVGGNSVWYRGISGDWFWSGGFTSQSTSGLTDLNSSEVPAYQREVSSFGVNVRSEATSSSDIVTSFPAGTVTTPEGWLHGERVSDISDIWYKYAEGYAWAEGFTVSDTSGLDDLNPVPEPTPVPNNKRIVGESGVNVRKSPSSSATVVKPLPANTEVEPLGWVTGENVSNISDIWYKLGETEYAWAEGFTNSTTEGLTNVQEDHSDDEWGYPGPVLGTIPDWEEVGPDYGTTNYSRPKQTGVTVAFPSNITQLQQVPVGGFFFGREARPNHIVLHHAAGMNLNGVTSTLNGSSGAPTANYVVKDNVVVSMVNEADTPTTNGRWRSNLYSVTVEVCNHGTNTGKPSEQSHETTAWVVARTAIRWGMQQPLEVGVNVFGHKDVSKSPTSCPGELDMKWITSRANEIIEELEETPANPSEPENPVEPPIVPPVELPKELLESIDALTVQVEELNNTILLATNLLTKVYRID